MAEREPCDRTEGGPADKEFPVEADFTKAPDWVRLYGQFPIPGVTDESSCLMKEFVPTRYELLVLARHYLDEAHKDNYMLLVSGAGDPAGNPFSEFARARVVTIKNTLGRAPVDSALRPVSAKWASRLADALALCQLNGVAEPSHLGEPEIAELLESAGFSKAAFDDAPELLTVDELLDRVLYGDSE